MPVLGRLLLAATTPSSDPDIMSLLLSWFHVWSCHTDNLSGWSTECSWDSMLKCFLVNVPYGESSTSLRINLSPSQDPCHSSLLLQQLQPWRHPRWAANEKQWFYSKARMTNIHLPGRVFVPPLPLPPRLLHQEPGTAIHQAG